MLGHGPATAVAIPPGTLQVSDPPCRFRHGHGTVPTCRDLGWPARRLDLLTAWALQQKAAVNRRVIAIMRQRLAAGGRAARMYQGAGLAWLERQAEVAEEVVVERQAASGRQNS